MSVFGIAVYKFVRLSAAVRVALLVALLSVVWAVAFADTFRFPFFWDDYHLVRNYSAQELLSSFHGEIDPDHIETRALRPGQALILHSQGVLFGENVTLQRVAMCALLALFVFALGQFLRAVGLGMRHLVIVLSLVVASRVYAAIVLWPTLSSLILCYLCMIATAAFFLRWVRNRSVADLILCLCFSTAAIFTREEAYTLPVVLPIIFWLSASDASTRYRPVRVLIAVLGIAVVNGTHFCLRHFLVPDAPPIDVSIQGLKGMTRSAASALLPGGLVATAHWDVMLRLWWVVFLLLLTTALFLWGRTSTRLRFLGAGALGVLLCAPSLGNARPFGNLLPTVAFMTAIALAVVEVAGQVSRRTRMDQLWLRGATYMFLALGVFVGVLAGGMRSRSVAEAMRPNCAMRVVRDGRFLFDMFPVKATIPAERREKGLARLGQLGIHSAADVREIEHDCSLHPAGFRLHASGRPALFQSRYEYLSF
jgi:hypothetical protein